MDENNYRFGVGVLVLAAAIVGVLLMVFFGAVPNFLVDRYRVTINFPSAPGVGPDTPVRKNGVNIGRVVSIKLLEDDAGVNLNLEIESQFKIRQGEKCQIAIGSYITQDAVVEFTSSTDAELLGRFDGAAGGVANGILDPEEREMALTVMSNGDLVQDGVVKGDPFDVLINAQGDLGKMLTAVERASQRVESLAGTVEDAVTGGRGQVRDVVDRVRDTIENVNGTVSSINRVAIQVENSRIPEAIAEGVERLPVLFDEARQVLQQTQRILASFEEFSTSIQGVGEEFVGIGDNAKEAIENANQALKNIAEFTVPLAENADVLVGDAGQVLRNLDAVLINLQQFSRRLNQGNGTIARLIDDEQLYFEVMQTIKNVRLLSQRLQPIADDVRVFTDKIARDPGQLGVRGALQGRPIGVGLK